jgi:hypothetical protein
MTKRRLFAAALAVATAIAIPYAYAAGLFPGFPIVGGASYSNGIVIIPAGPVVLTGKELIPADTQISGGASPQTVLIPTGLLGPGYAAPRNFIDNGAMNVAQRGTAVVTCAVNAAMASVNFSADRWGCQANVAAGAGRTQVITAAPAPPAGFTNSVKVFRTSGALTQPVCIAQAIPTVESTQLAGQQVTLSFYAAGLAGLVADNGGIINATIISGTGTDEGLVAAPTVSPAITPAWTGLTTVATAPFTVTTAFARVSMTATIPTTATEIGVYICFTPTATGAGATDGFAVTGVQLEVAPSPTAFEFRSVGVELAKAQRFFFSIGDAAATVRFGMCQSISTTVGICNVNLPVTMRAIPVTSVTTATSFGIIVPAGTQTPCTTLALLAAANSVNVGVVSCTSGATQVAGSAAGFVGAATGATNFVNWSADL